MISRILSSTLLISMCCILNSTPFEEMLKSYVPIAFNCPGIGLLDKLGLIKPEDNFRLIKQMYWLQWGKKNRETGLYEGQITYKDHQYTIRELVVLEQQANTFEKKELAELLENTLITFKNIVGPFFLEAQGYKEFVISVIKEWVQLRQRPHSLLNVWETIEIGQEEKLFTEMLPTFYKLNEFLDDLTLFMHDFIENCPVSLKKYKEELKEFEQKRSKQKQG